MSHSTLELPTIQLQLLLASFLAAYREIFTIQKSIPHLSHTKVSLPKNQVAENSLALEQALEKLLPADDYITEAPWMRRTGYISKIRGYGASLALSQPAWREFAKAMDTVWLSGRQALMSPAPQELARFVKSMEYAATHLPSLLSSVRNDENVMFFILRHHHEFDNIFGKGFTKQLLTNNDPRGLTNLHSFISKRYRQRGFRHLTKSVGELIEDLRSLN